MASHGDGADDTCETRRQRETDGTATGLRYEGQWEYFCRAGTTTPFWIDEPDYDAATCGLASHPGYYKQLEKVAWFVANAGSGPSYAPYGLLNPWNLQDTHGKLYEWCWDLYDPAYPTGSRTDYHGLPQNSISAICQTRDGCLWFGTQEGLSNDFVFSLYEDRAGSLWNGTLGGLNRLKDGGITSYTTQEGLSNNQVYSICEDGEGSLWIGTYGGGLNRFRDGKFTAYTMKDGLSTDQVFSIYEDREGSIWIGTWGGGLNRYRDGKFAAFATKDGLFDDTVFQFMEDEMSNLWMSCNKGIFRTSKKELGALADGKQQRITCVSYGTVDGMKSAECNGGTQPAGWKTQDGRLWFPTIGGVVVIDPARMPVNKLPPSVVIEDVLVDQKLRVRATAGSQIVLSPGTEKFEFHYTAPSFLAPQRVKFKYRLEGFDTDWVDAGTERTAHYTNLPPRRYTFRVIACNDDGIWNEAGASLTFILKPYFYQTNWFYALVGMTLIGAVHTLYRYRAQRMLELERVRTRIATDLHDEVGARLTHIAMIGETIHG